MHADAATYWIDHLRLNRHPEGGWFSETYRAAETLPASACPLASNVLVLLHRDPFLLEQGDFSALHRLKSDEIWHFYGAIRLTVHVITPEGERYQILLGPDAEQGERFQAVVPAGCWFGAETSARFSLVGCTLAPGFDFSDFEMGDRAGLTILFPEHSALIARMTKG